MKMKGFVVAMTLAMANMILVGAIKRRDTSTVEKKMFVTLRPEQAMVIIPKVTYCMEETGVNFDALSELQEGNERGDKKVDNFIKCSFRKTGYANIRGYVNIGKFMNLFPNMKEKGAVRKIVEECDDLPFKTIANKLRLFVICFMKKSPVQITL